MLMTSLTQLPAAGIYHGGFLPLITKSSDLILGERACPDTFTCGALSSMSIERTPSGLWAARYSHSDPRTNGSGPKLSKLGFRRDAVGATPIEAVLAHPPLVIPVNTVITSNPFVVYSHTKRAATDAADTLLLATMDTNALPVRDRMFFTPRQIRDAKGRAKILKSLLKSQLPALTRAYSTWWTLRSEMASLSQLRTERLSDIVHQNLFGNKTGKMPCVVKIALPFGKWNKSLGEQRATQMKWDILAVFKQDYSDVMGDVAFIDSTGISLIIPADQYNKARLAAYLEALPQRLGEYLLQHLRQKQMHDLRREEFGIEIQTDEGTWVPLSSAFADDIFVGVAQVKKPRVPDKEYNDLTTVEKCEVEKRISRAVHEAEIIARARAEKAAERASLHHGSGWSVADRIADKIAKKDLDLERNFFFEGYIPTDTDLRRELLHLYDKHIKDGDEIPQNKKQIARYVQNNPGWYAIFNLAAAVFRSRKRQEGQDTHTTEDYIWAVCELFASLSDPHKNPGLDSVLDYESHILDDFIDGAAELSHQDPHHAIALYEFMQTGMNVRIAHKAGSCAGKDGALTKMYACYQKLRDLFTVPRWSHTQVNDFAELAEEIEPYIEVMKRLVDQMDEALYDARFPGKVKWNALPYVVQEKFQGVPFHLVVWDYDNLAAFMRNGHYQINPLSRYDASKSQLEGLIPATAEAMGLTPNFDILYASPGADEMVVVSLTRNQAGDPISPFDFINRSRDMVGDRFGRYQSPNTYKVWLETPSGGVQQRWPIFYNETLAAERVAISLTDQAFLMSCLEHDSFPDRSIRVFRMLTGLESGGWYVDIPVTHFLGFRPETCSVGISATFVTVDGTNIGTMDALAGAIRFHTSQALHLLGITKTRYGKNQTWDYYGKLERALLNGGEMPLKPQHQGYHNQRELQERFWRRRNGIKSHDFLMAGQRVLGLPKHPTPEQLLAALGRQPGIL